MKWAIILIMVVFALIAVAYLIGYSMPVKHKASITLKLKAPPEDVWSVLTDYKSYPTWRSGLKKVESPDAKHWIEFSRHGTIQYGAEVFEPHHLFVASIKNKDLPFGGSWSFELTREGPGGTLLQITEDGEVYNPIFRFLSKYFFGHETTLKEYAMDISKKINGV